MKYYLDTEFIEGTQKKMFAQPTIDLISIGIVAEDGREYYTISKDFNLKEAWNRYDIKETEYPIGFGYNTEIEKEKVYWLRENVLKSIYNELIKNEIDNYKGFIDPYYELELDFNYKYFKKLINKYGKSNKQIAEEVIEFTSKHLLCDKLKDKNDKPILQIEADATPKEFYGYYADYDWVVFCWLFGKMIDLPKGFPMYCIDLKQVLDEASAFYSVDLKTHKNYPKQIDEHNALSDAR